MTCISPPALEDRQLLAYLDGEASEEIASHIEACGDCRERAQALAQQQNALQAWLFRLSCPPSEELGDYQLGLLPSERRAFIAQHLHECPHCSREIALLRDFLREPESPFLSDAWGPVKVLIARLSGGIDDAAGRSLPVALRGDDEGPITLEADGILIVLDLRPAIRGGWTVQGQVASEDQDRWTGARVVLHQAGEIHLETVIDGLGAFQFVEVPPLPAELHLLPEEGRVVIATLEFPA
jgi:hypothetical protein